MNVKLDQKFYLNLALASLIVSFLIAVAGVLPIFGILVSLLLCIMCIPIFFLIPMLGAYAAKQHEVTKDMMVDGIITGGLAGTVVGFCYSLVSTIISALASLLGISATTALTGVSKYTGIQLASVGIGSIIGIFFVVIVMTVSFALLGGIGGLIYAAINDSSKPKSK